jgi:hypothetical protein
MRFCGFPAGAGQQADEALRIGNSNFSWEFEQFSVLFILPILNIYLHLQAVSSALEFFIA